MNALIRLRWDPVQENPVHERIVRRHRRVRRNKTGATPLVLLALLLVAGFGAWCWDSATLEGRATRDNAEAQYRLGKRNLAVAKSRGECEAAAQWIRKAADQGYAQAQTTLGMLYIRGEGVRDDYSEAVKWLSRAADQGNPVAQNELGVIYAKGRGVPQNLEEAVHWCGKAAGHGSKIAARNLALIQAARSAFIGDLTTSDGKVLKQVTLQSLGPDGITVLLKTERGGVAIAKLKAENLTGQFRELCGYAAQGGTNSAGFSQLDSIVAPL
jgi:hypothetical protein